MAKKKKTSQKNSSKALKDSSSIQKEEPLFVGLSEPENVQRHILESTKESLVVLKKLEEIKELRKQKLQSIDVLNSLTSEIKSLLLKLKKKVPKKVSRPAPQKAESNSDIKTEVLRATKSKPQNKPVSKPNKPLTELEKLELELQAIENRLKR